MIDKIEELGLKILEKIKLKKLADLYRAHREGMRYLIFGGLTTIVNILVYIIFAKLILRRLPSEELIVNISEIIAFIAGVIFAYVTNKIYVFKSKTNTAKELLTEMISFTGCRIFTEIISILMMNMAVWLSINDVIMKIVSNIVVIILNFVFSKLLIFKKRN
jgi:putative flippase GtrA